MPNLVDALYPLPDYRRTPLSRLRWWESRRLFYNRVVGATGLVTLSGFVLLASLPPDPLQLSPSALAVPVIVYGVLANACFSLGWLVEMLAHAIWGRDAPDLGPLLFREGLIFSVGLTLLPLMAATLLWVVRIVLALAT